MAERSFKREVESPRPGEYDEFSGKDMLAVTRAFFGPDGRNVAAERVARMIQSALADAGDEARDGMPAAIRELEVVPAEAAQ